MNVVQGIKNTSALDDALRTIQEEGKEAMSQFCKNHNGKENGAEFYTLLIESDYDRINNHSAHGGSDERCCGGDGNSSGRVHDNDTEGIHEQRNTECCVGRIFISFQHIPDRCKERKRKGDIRDGIYNVAGGNKKVIYAQ